MSSECDVKYVDRVIPRISLRDFDARVDEITAELVAAAESYGIFVLTDHPVPQSAIDAQFAAGRRFFDLADSVKDKTPFVTSANAGWEKNSQARPSTGCVDRNESYQMQFSDEHMAGRWVADDDLPGFRNQSLAFMHACHSLSTKLMMCLARGLGLDDDQTFVNAHDITKPDIQTVLRALHYFARDAAAPTPARYCRAGPHADWSFLTLLFQRPGQGGLEMCPGRDAVTDFGHGQGDDWTKIKPAEGEIVCNIGDLLMFWSDDRFKSALHRVRTPTDPAVDYYGDRYSLAFFNQPNSDCVVQGPKHKYPRVTGREFTQLAMKRNFAQLRREQERQERQEQEQERGIQKERQSAMIVPPVEFQAATSFSPYTGSMDAGDSAAASAAFSMAACMASASASAMTASMM
ncbi:oxidoreductase domain containing protein [Ophiostoma piceae UAMH 11346]|uniref:Oxidoreductase domain containing protein n=1 Tax=Ophiostoma piceae (strain UAMH 11346) TaxID=1262450 RepID=S3CCN6_OPHP1|nr:oxidoreductase domain containing protein [Ophiostoma piceae UAMH 11346]